MAKWEPTRIKLRCDIDHKHQIFWRGTEANVKAVGENGCVQVVMKGRPMILKRYEYDIVSRRRIV